MPPSAPSVGDPAEVVALYWISNVFFFLGALTFLGGGIPVWLDGMSNVAMCGALDPALVGMTKKKAYEKLQAIEDPVTKRLAFWMVLQLRSFGCFQTAMGVSCLVVIFINTLQFRTAAHFCYFFLDALENTVEWRVWKGCGIGVDPVVALGIGTKDTKAGAPPKPVKKGTVAPELSEADLKAEYRPALGGGTYGHLFMGTVHLTLGIATIFVQHRYPFYLKDY